MGERGKSMFEIGQTVIYGMEGVCTIEERKIMKVGHTRASYYVLRPVFRATSTIFVPEDNALLLSKIRPVLSQQEILDILREVPHDEVAWIEDPNERKTEYQKILNGGERLWLIRLLHTLYARRQMLQKSGKHLRTGDEQMLRDAEKLLHDEFALVLNISQREVPEYIRSQIELSA